MPVLSSAPDSAIHLSEFAISERSKPGPKSTGNALVFRPTGLKSEMWDWIELWWQNGDDTRTDKEGKVIHNLSPAVGRAIEEAMRMHPHGPNPARPRGSGGRFLKANGSETEPRVSRSTLEARIRKLEAALTEAGIEVK